MICPSAVDSAAPRVPMSSASTSVMFSAMSQRLPMTEPAPARR